MIAGRFTELQYTEATRAGAGFCVALFCFAIAYAIRASGSYPGESLVLRYEAYLERTIRLLFLKYNVKHILLGQAIAIPLTLVGFVLTQEKYWLAFTVAAITLPVLNLMSEKMKRRQAFDEQADGFILSLSNSLKTVASIGGALHGIIPVTQDPVRQELALALNEMRLGNTVDQALLNAAARSGSPGFDSAISALLVGRQVGGNLPKILEQTAASLREINRLERVLKTKTSEGRAQMIVLSLFPAVIIFSFRWVNESYFDPLQYSDTGRLVAGVIAMIWLAAVMIARKVAQVNV